MNSGISPKSMIDHLGKMAVMFSGYQAFTGLIGTIVFGIALIPGIPLLGIFENIGIKTELMLVFSIITISIATTNIFAGINLQKFSNNARLTLIVTSIIFIVFTVFTIAVSLLYIKSGSLKSFYLPMIIYDLIIYIAPFVILLFFLNKENIVTEFVNAKTSTPEK